jgi:uncharacterized protein YjeT (DUF2065 family)
MMRRSTGLTLVAIGAILVLAVHVQLTVINLRLTGLILLITGLAGLHAPQRAYRWVRGHQDELREALDRFMAAPEQRLSSHAGCRWIPCCGRRSPPGHQRDGAADLCQRPRAERRRLVYLRFV